MIPFVIFVTLFVYVAVRDSSVFFRAFDLLVLALGVGSVQIPPSRTTAVFSALNSNKNSKALLWVDSDA